ncbi:MAG: hemolysin family protein, partial [Ignavibacteriales bacterium]|nr:hemolysin family protein [Ignavibacteriales bacterium]
MLRVLRKLLPLKDLALSEADMMQLLEEGKRSGAIDKTEHELIESIFEFTDTTVKEIMVPRTDVVSVDISMPREKLLRLVIDEGYSRIPVYDGSLDNIIGILYTKDLLSVFEHRGLIILQDVIRPPFLVPESKKISALMRELQTKHQHMAIVIDEFGGMEGIVTMEDIVEEIVGEIKDEYDEDKKDVELSSDGASLISGGMSVSDFNERFGASLPEGADYETISGFLHKRAGRIPELH